MASLDIISESGESLSYSFELLEALPAFAQVQDASQVDPAAEGRGVWLSALIPDDERTDELHATFTTADHRTTVTVPLSAVLEDALLIYARGNQPLPPQSRRPLPPHPPRQRAERPQSQRSRRHPGARAD
jgi:hypothetical protein